ncbi:MAG: methyltransferase domain-containing protein [Planctomycetota bacterium]|nr:MAG: methyltransferase domain-containing protein [Planctomycetota bacterium]
MSESIEDIEPGVQRVFQSRDEIRKFYNKIAHVYDLLAERSEQPMRLKGIAKLNPQPGERLLEIGFGTGHCLVELARAVGPTGRVYGIDLSDHMVQLAGELIRREGLEDRVEVTQGDAADLPYEDDFFDGIFSSFTLELFDTPELVQVLAEWRRVLKPGGRLSVVSLSKEGKQGMVIKAYEWTHQHFPNLLDCRPIYVRRALEAAGFEIRDAEIDHMWVPVEIVLGIKPAG